MMHTFTSLIRALAVLGALGACSSEDTPRDSSGGAGGSSGSSGSAAGGTGPTGGTGAAPSGGAGGSGQAASGGSGGSGGSAAGGAVVSDDYVSDVAVSVHEEVNTILVVTWNQVLPADDVLLEFDFEDDTVHRSRPQAGSVGPKRDVVLGVPADTAVTIRIVSNQAGTQYVTSDHSGTTGPLPSGLPVPEVMSYDATRASPERFMLGSVEDSEGGCGPSCYNQWTYWTYIMDRKGRMVWYYADPASNATSSYQRVARDGEYIWIEKRPYGTNGVRAVLKMTLDWEYFEQIPVPGLADCIDVTDAGSLLYNVDGQNNMLREMTRDGTHRDIWSCRQHFGEGFSCYSNTVNWNPVDDTIFMSFPEENTVVEIDRVSGELVASYGDAAGSYAFSPSSWDFEFQHFPNISPTGTLMVSSHMPGYSDTYEPVAGQHAFMEFRIDRENRTLIQEWVYQDGLEWAMYKGMAIRLENGNTLANYGSGGVIREITPDKQTVFYVKFDAPNGDDFYNKMVGHNVLVDDLYALNSGRPAP